MVAFFAYMMVNIEEQFQKTVAQIFPKQIPKKVAVAVSGGCDSMALLLLAKKLLPSKTKIFCLNVDHNYRVNSSLDSQFVADFCSRNSIECFVLKSNLSPPSSNIEGFLREIRYNLLNQFCLVNKIKHLFVAHHQQDLAENFLIRLFRGSGIEGLAAMQPKTKLEKLDNIFIIRPLLGLNKDALQAYLNKNKVVWVEDETNQDQKYLRNQIRAFLKDLPDIKNINSRIVLAAEAMLESKKLLQLEISKVFPKIFKFNYFGYFVVDVAKFQRLAKKRELFAKNLLALALMKISGNFYKPRREKLTRIYQLILSEKLFKAYSFYGCILERKADGEMFIYREKAAIKNLKISALKSTNPKQFWFDNRFKITIDQSFLAQDIEITTLNFSQFKQICQVKPELKNIKNHIKKILLTIPAFKNCHGIFAVPQINYFQYDQQNQLKAKINIIHN